MNEDIQETGISFIDLLSRAFKKEIGVRFVPGDEISDGEKILCTCRDPLLIEFFSLFAELQESRKRQDSGTVQECRAQIRERIVNGIVMECIHRIIPGTYYDFEIREGFVITSKQRNGEIIPDYPFYDSNHPSICLVENLERIFKGQIIRSTARFDMHTPQGYEKYFIAKIDSDLIKSLYILRNNLKHAPFKVFSNERLMAEMGAHVSRQERLLTMLADYLSVEHIGEQVGVDILLCDDLIIGDQWSVYSKSVRTYLKQHGE